MRSLPIAEIWREACRHIELGESLGTFKVLLAPALGPTDLEVHAFDPPRKRLERAAGTAPALGPWRQATDPAEVRALTAWIETRSVLPAAECEGILPGLVPLLSASSATWIGGLASDHGTLGLLLITLRTPLEVDRVALAALLDPVATALENHRRLHELIALREAADVERERLLERLGRDAGSEALVGADGGLAEVLARAQQVRGADLPVLLLGETGSGKEVVAREIHTGSPRASGPFIRVNCGAIPEELIDSELFGHERGSFTGATARRRGWFERADTGTLFLDEIGELPPAAQVRLLRVLQDGTFNRVGGEEQVHVDVRVIAATHRDLPLMVQEGRFRADLWYRVAVFPIVIPPLRERLADIPALAAHFARRAAHRFGVRPRLPTAADLALLAAYPWPGNVREFAAVIDRATILGNGEQLAIELALGFAAPRLEVGAAATSSPAAPLVTASAAAPGLVTLDRAMAQHIERALVATRGRIEGRGGTADLLGINPHTLRARMRKLGVDWHRFRSA